GRVLRHRQANGVGLRVPADRAECRSQRAQALDQLLDMLGRIRCFGERGPKLEAAVLLPAVPAPLPVGSRAERAHCRYPAVAVEERREMGSRRGSGEGLGFRHCSWTVRPPLPPATVTSSPLTWPESSSEARTTTARATSSATATFRSAIVRLS